MMRALKFLTAAMLSIPLLIAFSVGYVMSVVINWGDLE